MLKDKLGDHGKYQFEEEELHKRLKHFRHKYKSVVAVCSHSLSVEQYSVTH